MDNAQCPPVSVVIPAYKMEAFLAETLDSVLASDYPRLEVVVMDDGSPDASYAIACRYAAGDPRVRAFTKANGGVSSSRNAAIREARGDLILPVDADNTIDPTFISKAVTRLLSDPDIKVVAPTSDFFGEKTGIWRLPPFSLHLLARRNIMDNCALYRKADWARAGGYCETILTREDWAFWIAMLKDGGRVATLPEVLHHYRIRSNSKRVTHRGRKYEVFEQLNALYPEFFERELHGPLRRWRSWSVLINRTRRLLHPRTIRLNPALTGLKYRVRALPAFVRYGHGRAVTGPEGEEEELEMTWGDLTVRVVARPVRGFRRLTAGILSPTPAQRAFRTALKEAEGGITPVASYTERCGLLLTHDYYVYLLTPEHDA